MDKLAGLPLQDQTKWAVLFLCLQHKEAHLLSNTDWGMLRDELPAVEAASLRTLARIIGVKDPINQQRQQALLPHRHGGGPDHSAGRKATE